MGIHINWCSDGRWLFDCEGVMNDGVQITVSPDEEVGAIAIVMLWHDEGGTWYNSGLVVNESNPVTAFQKALGMAIADGLWVPD
jgi:hypothetical protein